MMTLKPAGNRARLVVLRIGHRIQRDVRVTTHVCLTARALGATGAIVAGVQDRRLVDTINRVTRQFGGKFTVETGKPWRQTITDWKKAGGVVVHLTAYGMPLPEIIHTIRSSKRSVLVVVGAEKVPGAIFHLADWNVAVTNQPISEVSALGIFLDWFSDHRELQRVFANGRIRIVPTDHGKRVVRSQASG